MLSSPAQNGQDQARLAHFSNADHFYNRRFSLPFSRGIGLLTIRIGSCKSFAIGIKDFDLVMVVFPALVRSKVCGFSAGFHSGGY